MFVLGMQKTKKIYVWVMSGMEFNILVILENMIKMANSWICAIITVGCMNWKMFLW